MAKLFSLILTVQGFFLSLTVYFFGSEFANFSLWQKVLTFITVLIISTVALVKLKRKDQAIRYSESIPKITRIFSNFINTYNKENLKGGIETLLTDMAKVLTLVKGEECHISLKVFSGTTNRFITYTRSENGASRKDRETYFKEVEIFNDFIYQCTDLKVIYGKLGKESPEKVYFFSNNLLVEENFLHPALNDLYMSKLKNHSLLPKWLKKELFWPLPYKSTIVVPLQFMKTNSNFGGVSSSHHSGVLCIDCGKKHKFSTEHDLHLMQILAEIIHLYINIDRRRVLST